MTPEEKQSELCRYRVIILATLNYLEEHLGGSFVCDQYDPVTEHYQQQKVQAEKDFMHRRLDRLQKRLTSLTKGLQSSIDLAYTPYIKEKTGYDIDIYEDLRKRVNSIIQQNEIRNQKELNDIGMMLHFYHETSADGEHVEKLKTLLTNYSELSQATSKRRKGEYSEIVSRVEKDGIEEVTIRYSTGPKPKYYKEQEATSPDGKRSLRVAQWYDGNYASTYVAVHFPTGSGAVYETSGIHPDVKALWKDNSTIVIETKREYTANAQHRQVRSFDDVINIEYIER